MRLFILGGTSQNNQSWVEELARRFGQLGYEATAQQYHHWHQENGEINFDVELSSLITVIPPDQPYVIFAKSAGTLLTMRGVAEGKLQPAACVFVGTAVPWGVARQLPVADWVAAYTVPTLFIQHTTDPVESFTELQKRFSSYPGQYQELPGDSHHYPEYETIVRAADQFFHRSYSRFPLRVGVDSPDNTSETRLE